MDTINKTIENLLSQKKNPIHIIGGGGVGMSGLAILLHNLNFIVTVSDKNNSQYLEKVSSFGITTWIGSQANRILKNSTCFYSTAIPEDDIEYQYCKQNNIPIFSRHPLLYFITKKYYTIAITGTHGKTTTTGWVAYLLSNLNLDPSALIGGSVMHWSSNIIIGQGQIQNKPILVIEADESDKSFLYIDYDIALVTNIEMDHVDHYSGMNEVHEHFQKFLNLADVSSSSIKKYFILSKELLENKIYRTFLENKYFDIFSYMSNLEFDVSTNRIVNKKTNISYNISLEGKHNLENAVLVMALSQIITLYFTKEQFIQKNSFLQTKGISVGIENALIKTLSTYQGVARRMQVLLDKKNIYQQQILVIDDYAHHPSEIIAVYDTLKIKYSHILVVWEPHRISRFCHFYETFLDIFENKIQFSKTYLLPIFEAKTERKDFKGFEDKYKFLQNKVAGVFFNNKNNSLFNSKEVDELVEELSVSSDSVVILFLGAGNSSEVAIDFSEKLRQKIDKFFTCLDR